ncbi:uncharacterized protein LOC110687460 [Chenopodium quinoa]|uniref:uncharacterized protein LOC110687460 n=1 Tax=Chenopodium quinoa TaxID=63459 RepID=UPI000B772002|nr:uncharacterized protein LOC110687460 [Chenopodium quinoa]
MASWAGATPKNQQMFNVKGFDENELMMGFMLSQKPGNDLIQNCDLPPPTKVFSGLPDNVTVISPMNRKKVQTFVGDHDHGDEFDVGDRKMGLLKALRLSQTRAREAEAKYAAITKERDALACAVVQDSMQIFAYRQFVKLLEFQVTQLQQQQKQQQQQVICDHGKRKQGDEGGDGSGSNGLTLLITMAFCLGIAGVGIAVGCKYFYS